LVKRKKILKGILGFLWDFLFTLGNNTFIEEYFYFEEGEKGFISENGKIKIIEKGKILKQDDISFKIPG
jgi:hypothetical protein